MAVPVPLSSLDVSMRAKIESDLQFQYKESTVVKSKAPPKIVNCYAPGPEQHIALPMSWAWKNLAMRNDYKYEKRSFERVKNPWNEMQANELEQAVAILEHERTLALTLRTGAGKTAVCLFCACAFKGFTVVLVHNESHATQWYNSVKSYTTAVPEIVKLDTNGIENETDILICLYTRWKKVAECVRRDVELLIVDEFDEFQNKTGVESIMAWYPRRVVGCTATFGKSTTGMNGIGTAILGTEIVTRQFDVKFSVNLISTGISGIRQRGKHTKGGVDWLVLKQSLLYNVERNKIIISLIKIRLSQGRKVMVLCSETKHVMTLYAMCKEADIKCDYLCGNKSNYIDSPVLIGGARKCGRGFDEESFCGNWEGVRIDDLILADYVNNETHLLQWLGRVFRCDDPIIDHLVDDDKTVQKQVSNMTKNVYVKLGATIEELSMIPTEQVESTQDESEN